MTDEGKTPSPADENPATDFEPRIIAFCCNKPFSKKCFTPKKYFARGRLRLPPHPYQSAGFAQPLRASLAAYSMEVTLYD